MGDLAAIEDTPLADWSRTIGVDQTGVFLEMKTATQALPNGYCELPMVRTCPHANSCLTCPMFVTSAVP